MKTSIISKNIPQLSARNEIAARVQQELERSNLSDGQREQLGGLSHKLETSVLSRKELRQIENELIDLRLHSGLPPKSTARLDTIEAAGTAQRPLFVGTDAYKGKDQLLLQLPKPEGKAFTVSVQLASESEVKQFIEAFDKAPDAASQLASLFEQTEAVMARRDVSSNVKWSLLGLGLAAVGLAAAVGSDLGFTFGAAVTLAAAVVPRSASPKESQDRIEEVLNQMISASLKGDALGGADVSVIGGGANAHPAH